MNDVLDGLDMFRTQYRTVQQEQQKSILEVLALGLGSEVLGYELQCVYLKTWAYGDNQRFELKQYKVPHPLLRHTYICFWACTSKESRLVLVLSDGPNGIIQVVREDE